MLALIGAIFHTIGGIIFIAGTIVGLGVAGFAYGTTLLFYGLSGLAVIFIVLAFLGAFWLYSGDKMKTMYGGVVTLIIAIVALPTIWGLYLGSILGFIGGFWGLVWSPTTIRNVLNSHENGLPPRLRS